MVARRFHIGDILSVGHKKNFSNRGMDGFNRLMSHIFGNEHVPTLATALNADLGKDFINARMPWVQQVQLPKIPQGLSPQEKKQLVKQFVVEAAKEHGTFHNVGQITDQPDAGPKSRPQKSTRYRAPAVIKGVASGQARSKPQPGF